MRVVRAAKTLVRIWPFVAAIFVLSFGVRLWLLSRMPIAPLAGQHLESINIARSLSRYGAFSDPFADTGPTGPTAHCLPLFPLIVALVIRSFGFGATAALALSWLASAAASLAYALLPVLGRSCSISRRIGISAGVAGALLPAFLWKDTLGRIEFWAQADGRWEAPFTFLALVCLASIVARQWQEAEFTSKQGAACGIAAAVATLFSANTLLILGFWFLCAFLWFSGKRVDVVRYFGAAFLVVLIALAPWVIRNRLVLGSWILTRSNFGLELQVSNNSISTGSLETNLESPQWHALHPSTSKEEQLKVLRMGEVAYNKAKKEQAIHWIRSNPKQFMKLTWERIVSFWFPRMGSRRYTILMAMITILAMVGIIRLWKIKPEIALLLGSACVAYSLVYIVIEASLRYRYPIEGFLLLLSSYALYSWLPSLRRS